jgi:YgiT-type zinc finger domain-containing protein
MFLFGYNLDMDILDISKAFPKCPVCGGEVIEKSVEEILRGGNNTAIVRVKAKVCLRCGERLFTPDTIAQFENIVEKLEQRETRSFEPIGQSYFVPVG